MNHKCPACGGNIINARQDAIYCSPGCKQRAYRDRMTKKVTKEHKSVTN